MYSVQLSQKEVHDCKKQLERYYEQYKTRLGFKNNGFINQLFQIIQAFLKAMDVKNAPLMRTCNDFTSVRRFNQKLGFGCGSFEFV